MTIQFNNDSENLIHDYLDHTTSSTLAQEIEQAANYLPSGSLTATSLTRALGTFAAAVQRSQGATAEQLRSLSSLLAVVREGDETLAQELRSVR
ncbi:cysteine desulfurase [Corynebacterium sp. L4756]|uniref:cysteine desulfurase n=1 Tax=unclassified Corynebacterium TaxID=2624378 RepID=UPI00374D955C